jgi:flagellar biosynthetic protein FliQ
MRIIMGSGQIFDITQRALYVATVVTAPLLIICLIIGIVISIFQAATQIHEQSLVFVPKIIVVLILLLVAGNWMVTQIADFTKEAFTLIGTMS